MANSALEIYMRLRHHYSAAPGSSEREQNEAQKGFKALGITGDSPRKSVEATMIEMTIWSKK